MRLDTNRADLVKAILQTLNVIAIQATNWWIQLMFHNTAHCGNTTRRHGCVISEEGHTNRMDI